MMYPRRPVILCYKDGGSSHATLLLGVLALLDDAIRGNIIERLFPKQLVKQLDKTYIDSMTKESNTKLVGEYYCFVTSRDPLLVLIHLGTHRSYPKGNCSQ